MSPRSSAVFSSVVPALLLVATSCSLWFDPSRAPPRCGARAPLNPESLAATVGEAGVIEWSWPAVAAAASYALCTSVVGGQETCRSLAPTEGCGQGTCTARDEGLALGVRLTARVQSVDDCALAGDVTSAPRASATPISTADNGAGWILQASCSNTTTNIAGGLLSIEQSGQGCVTSFVTGDELWDDFTIEADVRVSPVGGDGIAAGLALHTNATGHRLLALANGATYAGLDASQLRVRDGTVERVVATSIRALDGTGGFTHFRLTSSRGVISWQLGQGATQREVLRWPDTSPHAGRLGIAASGAGRIEVQNFTVRTGASLPLEGPSTLRLDFADGGWETKTRLSGVSSLAVVPCPAYDAGCSEGCGPAAPGTQCALLSRVGLGLGYPLLGFDLPVGLDARRAWQLDVSFATPPDATGYAVVLDSAQGGLLVSSSPTDNQGLDATLVSDGGLANGRWHLAHFSFQPDAGRFEVAFDGQPVAASKTAFPPAGKDRFLGGFTLGNFWNGRALYVSKVTVSQPP